MRKQTNFVSYKPCRATSYYGVYIKSRLGLIYNVRNLSWCNVELSWLEKRGWLLLIHLLDGRERHLDPRRIPRIFRKSPNDLIFLSKLLPFRQFYWSTPWKEKKELTRRRSKKIIPRQLDEDEEGKNEPISRAWNPLPSPMKLKGLGESSGGISSRWWNFLIV